MYAEIEAFIAGTCGWKGNETPAAYRSKLRRLANHLGEIDVREVTPATLNSYKLHLLQSPLSPWTVKSTLATVKHFFAWLADNGYLESNPAERLKIPSPPPPSPKAIETGDALAILHAAARTGPVWYRSRNLALIYLLIDTNARVGGLLSARVDAVDLLAGRMALIEKGKPRDVYFNPPTGDALGAWLKARRALGPRDAAVFLADDGKPLTRAGVTHILRTLGREAGVTGRCNPHSFRHAWAREALRSHQADLSQVSQLMGHSSIAVTALFYARWADRELQAVHRRASPGVGLPVIHIEEQ